MLKEYVEQYGKLLLNAILIHMGYVFVCVMIGFVLGIVLGSLFSKSKGLSRVFNPVLSALQTIPGIVFIGVLFILIGMKPATVIVALAIYATFPVLRNTYSGIINVENQYVEAAKGCGMSVFQSLIKVELPIAFPVILSGLRMSVIYTISWAVIAAIIGQGGLGGFIYQGTDSNNAFLILLGAIPAALLALILGKLIDVLQRKLLLRRT